MTNSTLPDQVLGITSAPVMVGRYVPVGTGALLLPGSQVEEGAAIHAMSVVAGMLPAWTICGGNPAKPLGPRSRHLLDHAARLGRDGDA